MQRSQYHDPAVRSWLHFVPQHQFLLDGRGRLGPVDFIGYFEHLTEDFQHVVTRLGIDPAPRLEVHNKSSDGSDFRARYTDETRAVVARHYARDIELFRYAFDARPPERGTAGPAVPAPGAPASDVWLRDERLAERLSHSIL